MDIKVHGAIPVGDRLAARTERIAVDEVGHEEIFRVIHGDGPGAATTLWYIVSMNSILSIRTAVSLSEGAADRNWNPLSKVTTRPKVSFMKPWVGALECAPLWNLDCPRHNLPAIFLVHPQQKERRRFLVSEIQAAGCREVDAVFRFARSEFWSAVWKMTTFA